MTYADDLWPPSERYRTAHREEVQLLPKCRFCGLGHIDPLPHCAGEREDDDLDGQ